MMDQRYTDPVYLTWLSLMAKEEAQGYESLTPEERVFWNVYLLELEVDNGGYDQYFHNSSGEYANEVVAALRTLGAVRAAEITQAAIDAVFPRGFVPVDQEQRWQQMRESEVTAPKALNGPTHDYWNNEQTEDVFPLLQAFAEKHGFLVTSSENTDTG